MAKRSQTSKSKIDIGIILEPPVPGMQYILGIDPALSTTGYAVLNSDGSNIVYIGKIVTIPKDSDDTRILSIVKKLVDVANLYGPDIIISMEDGYVSQNKRTAMQLASLRGAIAVTFGLSGHKIYKMQPSDIRKAVCLNGSAKKDIVAEKIIETFGKKYTEDIIGPYSDKQNKNKTSDMYDAISIALASLKSDVRKGG